MRGVKIGIKGYRYVRSESQEKEIVHLELAGKPVGCPRCGSLQIVGKGRYERRARHLDTFGRRSELKIQTGRWQCRGCGRTFLPLTPGLRPWKRSTEPWRESVYRDHHEGICASAMARLRAMGSASVERIYAEFTNRKARERLSVECPQVLGIDEHRVHRGMPFATTFCDLKNHRIFDIVPGRSEGELRGFLSRLKGRDKVRVVCIDLSSPYRCLVRAYFPRAKIVADRFHVMRVIIHHFMELARQIAPEIKNHRGLLGALRKRKDNLIARDHERLAKLFARYPALKPLYEKMHDLRSLMNIKHQTKRACRPLVSALLELISDLKQSAFAPLKTLAQTLHSWREPLAAMWRFTKNNGITEGFHRKMKLIQRRAYGFKNFNNYRLRVIAQCG